MEPPLPEGWVAAKTAVSAKALRHASELMLTQFPADFELSRLAGVRLELRAAPDASGEVASAWLPGGGHITFLQEDDSLAAQLCAVAAPSKGVSRVSRRLTAVVHEGAAPGDEAAEEAAEHAEAPSAKAASAAKRKKAARDSAGPADAADPAPAIRKKKRKSANAGK